MSTTFTLKNKILTALPDFISRPLYSINHKASLFKKELPDGQYFEIVIPHTMMANYQAEHERGVLDKIMDQYSGRKLVFFDVGACFGYFSGLIHTISKADIYTFEPFIGHYMFLEKTVRHNPSGSGKRWKITRKLIGSANAGRMISLDEFCRKNNVYPDLMKIDVDGAELDVLKGCRDIIARGKTSFLIEFDCKNILQWEQPFKETIRQIFGEDYRIEYLKDVHINHRKWETDFHNIDEHKLANDVYLHLVPLK